MSGARLPYGRDPGRPSLGVPRRLGTDSVLRLRLRACPPAPKAEDCVVCRGRRVPAARQAVVETTAWLAARSWPRIRG